MGPVEAHLRRSCRHQTAGWWIANAGTMPEARTLIYSCGERLFGRPCGVADMLLAGLIPDIFSEAIEAAEALGL